MKRYLPKNAEDASALILTLLVIALLSAIVTSFLSTSRTELMATRNYSSKTQAEQFAISATQQAMAKIQQGFTVNGTATTVITTQPGAIWQYTFASGSCNAVTGKNPVGLFSGTGNATSNVTANLNNLQNPSSNATLTSNSSNNQWTITGNAAESINVPLENITSNGTVIGRIAYYVDDEGAKLNLNGATGDRTTLNIGNSRSLSLSSLANASQSINFTNVVEGNATSSSSSAISDIKNWAHFFRPEQIAGAVSGFNGGDIPKLSSAPVAGSDYHLKRTPWGTPRLFINDLPTDSANATASVNAIYNALSDSRLRDIYGATFEDKYTTLGLKQIAANMLQMRDPNTNTVNASFTSTAPRIGASGSQVASIAKCCATANTTTFPTEYFGQAPYAYINEVGVMVGWGSTGSVACFQIAPFLTIINPESYPIPKTEVDKWRVDMMIDSFTVDITYKDSSGNIVGPNTYGPTGYKNQDPWGHSAAEFRSNRSKRNAALGGTTSITEGEFSAIKNGNYFAKSDGSVLNGSIPAWSQTLNSRDELQICTYKYPWPWGMQGLEINLPSNVQQIVSITNMKLQFEYISLSSVTVNTTVLRDFVLGSDMGDIDCWMLPQPGHPWNRSGANLYYPTTPPYYAHPMWDAYHMVSPDFSLKRIDGRIRFSGNMTTNASANATANTIQRSYMRGWSTNSTQSWPTKSPASNYTSSNSSTNIQAYPSVTSGNPIPGDPVANQSLPSYDFPDPFASTLKFTSGNTSLFTSPQELGKVHTNVQHRKLRFTTQHPNEVATGSGGNGNQTFIPDWAMLDVISFGSNVTSVPLPAPVNMNGRFYVPSGSPQPAARTAGMEAALKALDSATLVGNSFNASITATTNRTQYIGSSGNVSSTIAGNIGNLTWSTGNFTSGNSTWGKGNSTADPGSRRKTANFPANQFVLPAEVTEIRTVSDVVALDSYTINSTNIKANEGRLSALFPGATTQSRFFTIYAYAQAGQLQDKTQPESASNPFVIDSEAVTKTLVEVVENTSTTPSTYTVKKLYSQNIQSN